MTVARQRKPATPVRTVAELVVTVAVAVGLALLVQAFLVKPYKIPSPSMEPTLAIGQRIFVNRLNTHPGLGDVVVFHPPAGANAHVNQCEDHAQGPGYPQPCDLGTPSQSPDTYVKRVVGLPGDHLRIFDGYVWDDGKKETGSYIQNCGGGSQCTFSKPITVPRGSYYMMGDNRGDSDDSRYWGPVPQKNIIGVAVFTYWPLNRIGTL